MAKETCPLCRGKKGSHQDWGTHGKGWYPCSECKGKGFIFIPDPPKPPRQQKPQPEQRQRQEKSQSKKSPQSHKASLWLHKACGRPKCTNVVDYQASWQHVPNFCKICKAELEWFNQKHVISDLNYIMPGLGETIAQMGGVDGVHYPRQGSIHCLVYQGHSDDDQHYAWNYDVVKQEIIGQVYMHPNNPGGKKR